MTAKKTLTSRWNDPGGWTYCRSNLGCGSGKKCSKSFKRILNSLGIATASKKKGVCINKMSKYYRDMVQYAKTRADRANDDTLTADEGQLCDQDVPCGVGLLCNSDNACEQDPLYDVRQNCYTEGGGECNVEGDDERLSGCCDYAAFTESTRWNAVPRRLICDAESKICRKVQR